MKLRMIAAIMLCKLLRFSARILHRGGTAMPGRYALKLCPNLLTLLAKDVETVAITGTNGKTTSARMVEQAFADAGLSYFSNRSGANLNSGIVTEFVMNCTLGGKMKKKYAVIECDEAAAKTVFGQLKPRVIVVTNLFRDQLDRFGEVTYTLQVIREGILKTPESVLCLNADCCLTASLAGDTPNEVVWYGMDKGALSEPGKADLSEAARCIRCGEEYEFDYINYGHLGGFRCPKCGYARHECDYAVTEIISQELSGTTAVFNARGEANTVNLALAGTYNVYNAAGAMAAVCTMGLGTDTAVKALESFKCGFGRMERFELGRSGATMMLFKNPAGCDQVLNFLKGVKESFVMVICLNDRAQDGKDVSWVWDADFESLASSDGRLTQVVVSGDRMNDMAMRLKYAGVPEDIILLESDYEKIVQWMERQEKHIFIMPTYTAMLELREVVVRRTGGKDFWEG